MTSSSFHILTDMPPIDKMVTALRDSAADQPVLAAILQMIDTGSIQGPSNSRVPLGPNPFILDQAALFYYLITATKPILSIQTGFTSGIIASIMIAAHMSNGLNGGHVPIQDQAKTVDNGIGFYTLERLKLTGFQLMEHEPALVLPQLYLQQLNDGLRFAYLNSAQYFDEQMMEYFYLDRLLNEGGIFAVNHTHAVRQKMIDIVREERHDYAFRVMDCGVTLIQKPALSALVKNKKNRSHH